MAEGSEPGNEARPTGTVHPAVKGGKLVASGCTLATVTTGADGDAVLVFEDRWRRRCQRQGRGAEVGVRLDEIRAVVEAHLGGQGAEGEGGGEVP